MSADVIRKDVVARVKNAVDDLRHEWQAAGEDVSIFVTDTQTGVSVSVVAKVGATSTEKDGDKDTPLSKKKI